MRSIKNLKNYPAALPLISDNVTEFHAARLLLLLHICGIKGRIEGLTKLAKLDFFVRYPGFFARVSAKLNHPVESVNNTVESNMVRHHYGPWDKRYYQILAYLEGRKLLEITKKNKKTFVFFLTDTGKKFAQQLASENSFNDLCEHMDLVKKVLGSKRGSALKTLIYNIFEEEVAQRPLGEVIQT